MGNTRFNLETGELEIIKPLETFEEGNLTCYKSNGVCISEDINATSSFALYKTQIQAMLTWKRQLKLLNDEYFPAK